MYLLNTNIVSELRKARPHGGVLAWVQALPESQLFIATVTLGAIQAGIELTRQQNAAKALEIETWLNALAGSLQVLAADGMVYRQWARLMHQKNDHHSVVALIAATAQIHGLTVATRNTKDFKGFGVALINPFTAPRH